MEKENEIVVYENESQIVDYNFARIDMNQPATILSFGSDVKDQISAILDSTAQMSIAAEEVVLDEETINSISSFDDSLNESEKQRNKKELALVKGIKGFLAKMGVDKFEDEERLKTYKGRYDEYCRGISLVVEAVEKQKQASLNDIQLRDEIIKEMTPLIEQLEVMVKVGHEDKAKYDAETEEIKNIQPQTMDTEYQVQFRTQLSEVLNNKLHELEKAVVLYKEQIQTYRLQQKTDMQLTMEADSYIRDQAPILKAQGSVMVFNRQQADRITRMQKLNEKSNEAITNNARQLEQNVQATIDLALNQGISVDTLKVVDQSLRRGVDLFRNGRIQKQQQVESQRSSLKSLSESLDAYQQEVLKLIQDESAVVEVLSDSTPIRKTLTPYKSIPGGRK